MTASDLTRLTLRLATGGFLVHGTVDNIVGAARMAEFVRFCAAAGFPWPAFAAPFSVYTQCASGFLLILGLWTRAAGLFIAATFVVALGMVHWGQPLRDWWPALALLIIGLDLAAGGAGRLSLDARRSRGKRR